MTPLVSIILPTYNRAAVVHRSMTSLLGQTFQDLEVIIVDDGSTDHTLLVLEQWRDHSQVRIFSTPHCGSARARNIGLRAARGELIAFQDSDDEWYPEKLEISVDELLSSPEETGVFYSSMMAQLPDEGEALLEAPHVERGALIDETSLDYQVFGIGLITSLIRRTCFEKIGQFDENLRRYIDLDIFIRLSQKFDFHRYPQPLVRYFVGNGISRDTAARVHARRYLIEKYGSCLSHRRYHLAGQYLFLAAAQRDNNQYRTALLSVFQALMIAPGSLRVARKIFNYLWKKPSGFP